MLQPIHISMAPKKILSKCILLVCCLLGFMVSKSQNPYPNTGDHQVCINATEPYGVVLNAGSTYAWTVTTIAGGNGTIAAGATPNLITVNWTSAGTAKLQVIETNASGCTGDPVSIIVTVLPKPTVTVNSSAICAGTSATIIATPGAAGTYNYAWNVPAGVPNPGNVASFSSTVAGTYSVIITAAGTSCSSAPASGTVTINALPTLVITDPSICGSGTADLTAPSVTAGSTAGLTFTYWTDAAATIPYATPTAAGAGTYYIKGSLGAGCFNIKPVTVSINAAPTPAITGPSPVCQSSVGGTVIYSTPLVAGHTYSWSVTGGTIVSGQNTSQITVSWATPGAATVSVTETITAGGCTATITKNITVTPRPVTTAITHN